MQRWIRRRPSPSQKNWLLRRAAFVGAALAVFVLFEATPEPAGAQNKTIDPTDFTLTFNEEFDGPLDVSAWGPGTRWIAHTPWNGDFGDSKFADPEEGFPFVVEDGILRIEARKGDDGVWRSGLLSSVGRDWTGFSQQYGYFEIKAKLPKGLGLWPAFWFIGIDRAKGGHTAEIDVFEHYGHKPGEFSSGFVVWNRDGVKGNHVRVRPKPITAVDPGSLYDRYNTWGMRYDKNTIEIYFNRQMVFETKTFPEFRQPMLILFNLAMGPGWPIDKTPNPSFMYVDYVKAWQID